MFKGRYCEERKECDIGHVTSPARGLLPSNEKHLVQCVGAESNLMIGRL